MLDLDVASKDRRLTSQVGSSGAQSDNSYYHTDAAVLQISYFSKNGTCGCEKACLDPFSNENILNKNITFSYVEGICD